MRFRVALRAADGSAIAGRPVTIRATGDGNAYWPAATVPSDAQGIADLRVSSTVSGRKRVSFEVGAGADATTLPNEPEVEFVATTVPRRRVSESSSGAEGNDFSRQAAVSADGRYVAFQSKADNLVPGDSNEKEDVFVHDRTSGTTERVSLLPSGGQFNDLCGDPSLSDDGFLVAFEGRQSDTDAVWVRDRILGTTEPISGAAGLDGRCFAPAISGNGRWVAFLRDNGESQLVYAWDRVGAQLLLISRNDAGQPADGACYAPSISRDGRWITFASIASNLVGDDSNDKIDVFVHDRLAATTRRVSVRSDGAEGNDDSVEPAIAADGRWVAFASKAEDLVAGDDNGKSDVFVHDLQTGTTTRHSVDPQGNEVDKESWLPVLSADGTWLVFSSLSDDLAPGDTNGKEDVFCRDLVAGTTRRVSLALGGGDPDEFCTAPALAADAPVVAFTAKAGNMVPSDENDTDDVFVAPRN